jgi:(2Fe-2S) ferredoxin
VKSLEELKQIREAAQKMMYLRQGESTVRIIVGMGTCGIAAGARTALGAIMDELEQRNLTNVVVTQTGCIGLCDQEPLVDVIMQGQPRVTYGRVDGVVARQIIASHVVGGKILEEWVVKR